MLSYYLLIAVRNFRRRPGYTLLNLIGLALGIAAGLIIMLYIRQELSFDRHHEKADQIFRISADITEPDAAFRWAFTQAPLARTLKEEFSEVQEYTRYISMDRTRLEYEDRNYFAEDVYMADSTVFDVFTYNFTDGDPLTALDRPNCIVLNTSLARRIFGSASPIGKYLDNDGETPYEVTGVYQDQPRESHLIANAVVSSGTNPNLQTSTSWGGFGVFTYVLLKPNTDPAMLEPKLADIIDKYVATIFDEMNIKVRYVVVPLTDIHLTSDFQGEPEPAGNMAFIFIFGAVAVFLLLIACINYMNLATARATQRALEVGMRKVLGSPRRQLIGQFLAESFLLTAMAFLLAFILVLGTLPGFNQLFGLNLDRMELFSPYILLGMLLMFVLIGLISGSYPAFYLSGFRPIAVLKGKLSRRSGNPRLRQGLVVLQFAITLFMIIGTGIIYDQMNYIRNKELGFDQEQVLTFSIESREAREKWPVLREKLLQDTRITMAGTASTTPGEGYGRIIGNIELADGGMEQLGLALYQIDYDFVPTMNMELVKGRNFSLSHPTDSTQAVLVNEAMVRRMNWDEAIGKKVQIGQAEGEPPARVVGVIKDFHQEALYNPIEPLVFVPNENNAFAHIRIKSDVAGSISKLESMWQEVFPNQPFEFSFVDDRLGNLYESDQIRSRIFSLFSILMILIACLGLLGLSSFTAEQRSKEIGIRKVVGASTPDIVVLLTRDYLWLIALASLPAFLAGWYVLSRWLDTFAYHTDLNFWLFALAFLATLVIALATTSYYALRAAGRNPVDALRYE